MKRYLMVAVLLCAFVISAGAQVDRREVRSGNRKFSKDEYKTSEIDYRKALVKDSTSIAGNYNLASSLYRQGDYQAAGSSLEKIKEAAGTCEQASDYYFNLGDVALQNKDYGAAVEAFKQSLLRKPDDIDAKENYIYAKLMLQNQQQNNNQNNNQDQNQQQDQDQDQDQNQDQQQNQNQQNQNGGDDNQQDQNQDRQQDRDRNQAPQPRDGKISQQQAQQMLRAIQAKEKETQDKVDKEKAAALKSREKEKNW